MVKWRNVKQKIKKIFPPLQEGDVRPPKSAEKPRLQAPNFHTTKTPLLVKTFNLE